MRGLKLDDGLEDGVWFIRGDGHLDASTVDALDQLIEAVFRQGCHQLCFDFSGITSISSTGAGVLLAAQNRAQVEGGGTVFMNLPDSAHSAFDSLGLLSILQVVPTRADAHGAFKQPWGSSR